MVPNVVTYVMFCKFNLYNSEVAYEFDASKHDKSTTHSATAILTLARHDKAKPETSKRTPQRIYFDKKLNPSH